MVTPKCQISYNHMLCFSCYTLQHNKRSQQCVEESIMIEENTRKRGAGVGAWGDAMP